MTVLERLDIYSPYDDGETYIEIVQKDGRCGVIDNYGNVMADFEYDNITPAGPGVLYAYLAGKLGLIVTGMDGLMFTECEYDRAQYHDNYVILNKRNEVFLFMTNFGELPEALDCVIPVNDRIIEIYCKGGRTLLDTLEGEMLSDDSGFSAENVFETETGYAVYETGSEESRLLLIDDYSEDIEEIYFDELVSVLYGPGIRPEASAFICSTDGILRVLDKNGMQLPLGGGTEVEVEMSVSAGDGDKMNIAGVSAFEIKLAGFPDSDAEECFNEDK